MSRRDEFDALRARFLHAAALTLELGAARLELAATRIDARRMAGALVAAARARVDGVLGTHPDLTELDSTLDDYYGDGEDDE